MSDVVINAVSRGKLTEVSENCPATTGMEPIFGKSEKTIAEAVEVVVTQVGRSALISMLTTISVFSILSFSDFQGFSEFGKIATLGIICAFITYYFLFPAQALFYDKIHWLVSVC